MRHHPGLNIDLRTPAVLTVVTWCLWRRTPWRRVRPKHTYTNRCAYSSIHTPYPLNSSVKTDTSTFRRKSLSRNLFLLFTTLVPPSAPSEDLATLLLALVWIAPIRWGKMGINIPVVRVQSDRHTYTPAPLFRPFSLVQHWNCFHGSPRKRRLPPASSPGGSQVPPVHVIIAWPGDPRRLTWAQARARRHVVSPSLPAERRNETISLRQWRTHNFCSLVSSQELDLRL